METIFEAAAPSDIEELLGLYFSVYGRDYPLPLGTDRNVMARMISSPDILLPDLIHTRSRFNASRSFKTSWSGRSASRLLAACHRFLAQDRPQPPGRDPLSCATSNFRIVSYHKHPTGGCLREEFAYETYQSDPGSHVRDGDDAGDRRAGVCRHLDFGPVLCDDIITRIPENPPLCVVDPYSIPVGESFQCANVLYEVADVTGPFCVVDGGIEISYLIPLGP